LPRIKSVARLYIETGKLWLSQKLSGLALEEFIEHLWRAGVWIT
jgi:hypothetical protein